MASVLSENEARQIYNVFQELTGRLSSFCMTDASGQCLLPFIGLKRPAGTAGTTRSSWTSLKWTDGNDISYFDWGSGEPNIGIRLSNLMYYLIKSIILMQLYI